MGLLGLHILGASGFWVHKDFRDLVSKVKGFRVWQGRGGS